MLIIAYCGNFGKYYKFKFLSTFDSHNLESDIKFLGNVSNVIIHVNPI